MFNKRKISISGIHPDGLTIKRDASGTPLIKAQSYRDALWGSGYAHGVDRSTQLLMMRILGRGRLCELLSDNEESLAIDQFFRRANWHSYLDKEVEKLDEQSRELCQSYCDGVNAAITAKGLSALKLLGYRADPWTIEDSILITRMSSYLTLAQSQAEVERLFIELVQSGLPSDRLTELFPVTDETFDRELIESINLQDKIVANEVIWNLALPRMMASNNWVISGQKTKSGHALMANDPHLEVNRLPNVWCQQNLAWPGGSCMGMGMPGFPAIIIGRTAKIAWGVTYTFMDTIDSWVEECRGGQYYKDGQWHNFNIRAEIIKRKNSPDHTMMIYDNEHGVLAGNPERPGRYLATRWVAAHSGAQSLMSSLKLAQVATIETAMTQLRQIESAWNWVVSDNHGNIGYQMSGLMPKRHTRWNGFTPAPGWDSKYDWQGTVDSNDLPQSINPNSGYIVTANQDLNHLGNVAPINMPMGDYRARRIEQVLAANDNHCVESTKALQFDVYSIQAKEFLAVLLPLLESSHANNKIYKALADWDCCYDFDSIGAPLFEAFYSTLREQVFGEQASGMGVDVVRHLSEQSGVFIDFYQNFDRAMLNPDSGWYSGLSQAQAFGLAFEKIKHRSTLVRWKDVNTVSLTNILFQGKLPKFLGFDSEPIPLLGGRATPHQGQVYRSEGRNTSFCPTVRLIADMNTNILHTCLAGGPSDNRFSRWYLSSLNDWLNGKYTQSDSTSIG